MSERLALCAIVAAALSGVPGLFFGRTSIAGQRTASLLAVVGSLFGFSAAGAFWAGSPSRPIVAPWALPGAEFHIEMDGLSAVFLLPIFLVSLCGNIYGLAYWKQTEHPENGRGLRLFYGTLTAGMALLVVARNAWLFLFGWEIMALSAFFLVTTEHRKKEVREAGWIYIVATHVATLFLFAVFSLLHAAAGSYTLVVLPESATTARIATPVFVLSLLGFGIKAGLMPLHVWLPSSHATAPSHVSAILSGVILKMGVYGLVRVTSFFPNPPLEWGGIVLALAVVSGVFGVAYAVAQHDLKRLLAYHSIENIGIIMIGVGLALAGRSLGRPDWVMLGMAGALLHVWNHAFFKALLFLSAGSVIHAAGTREIDELGGLAKRMPRTAACFLIGAVAICGLPPLNGFVSEFLIYVGVLSTIGGIGEKPALVWAAFVAPALALIGGLALACFVKVYGAVFLGSPRSDHARHCHESPAAMIVPMAALATVCFAIGLAPTFAAPILESAVFAWAPEIGDGGSRLLASAPLQWIGFLSIALTASMLATGIALSSRIRNSPTTAVETWGCGYVATTPKMQYTASSFAQILVGFFAWVLHTRVNRPGAMPTFPPTAQFHSDTPDGVLDDVVLPTSRGVARMFGVLRVFQQGSSQTYLLYVFVALIALLFWR